MGFGVAPWHTNNQVKLIRKYVYQRAKEKRGFNDQLKRIDSQLQNNTIDEYAYKRLRIVLEINFFKQREQALKKAFLEHK
jgi:hypothetical protein